MLTLLNKEIKLSANILSFIFIAFGFMFFLPGYPILCGAFFVSLGIFQSFQSTRENNDILFSALLPIPKKDIVKAKYLFVCMIEICAIAVMCIAMLVRMTVLSEATVYRTNALMNANPFALGLGFVIFGEFNALFVGGFFKTSYKFGKPFILYIVFSFLTLGAGEALHHFPGLEFLNAFGSDFLLFQLFLLFFGIVVFLFLTFISYNKSCERFEKTDL